MIDYEIVPQPIEKDKKRMNWVEKNGHLEILARSATGPDSIRLWK
jgi:hypothetical protein